MQKKKNTAGVKTQLIQAIIWTQTYLSFFFLKKNKNQ